MFQNGLLARVMGLSSLMGSSLTWSYLGLLGLPDINLGFNGQLCLFFHDFIYFLERYIFFHFFGFHFRFILLIYLLFIFYVVACVKKSYDI